MWRFDRTLSPDRGRHALHCSLLNFCTHLHALPSFSLPSARFRNFPTLQLAPDTFGSVPFKAYPTSPTSQLQRNESPYDWELSARASHETLLFTCKSSSLLPPTPSSFNVETMYLKNPLPLSLSPNPPPPANIYPSFPQFYDHNLLFLSYFSASFKIVINFASFFLNSLRFSIGSSKMRMSCNGCRVLRKGCSENCSIRPCLQWIKSPESQANATVFLAKFYGRAGLMNLVNAGPEHLRPAIFRSLLYEACGRIVNPIYGSVGLLWSGSWQLCQAAVENVLKGAPITPITSEAAASGRCPPLKAYDIRHVFKDENSAAASNETQHQRVKTRSRVKRPLAKPKSTANQNNNINTKNTGTEFGSDEPGLVACDWTEEALNRSGSHDSTLSHQSEAANAVESESILSAETSILFRDEPESNPKRLDRTDDVGLELTLGFEPVSGAQHVVPVKKRRIDLKDFSGSSCKMELGLECSA
ncbi:LOB domain-containing protein 41 [Glycine soja]|nr:LOB domain-containing protein 41 [Glycine soja]